MDAHVGKSIFYNAIIGSLGARGKTVLLVTHALHFVADVDYVFMMRDGRIEEEGSYQALMTRREGLWRLMQEHGGAQKKEENTNEDADVIEAPATETEKKVDKVKASKLKEEVVSGTTKEKRSTGSVSWRGTSVGGHHVTSS